VEATYEVSLPAIFCHQAAFRMLLVIRLTFLCATGIQYNLVDRSLSPGSGLRSSGFAQYNDVPGSDEEMELGMAGSDASMASEGALLFHKIHSMTLSSDQCNVLMLLRSSVLP